MLVIPDGVKRRSGTQLSTPVCAERWIPALASLGRDDSDLLSSSRGHLNLFGGGAGRNTRLFARNHDSDELAALDRSGVDADRDGERHVVGVGSDRALLRFQHGLVLIEGADDSRADSIVERAVVAPELAHDPPEIM